MSFVLVRD
jgi:hypothetical protein